MELGRLCGVKENGAILLGKYFAVDGDSPDRPVGVITHAHGDHTGGFHSSLHHCNPILMTEATYDLLVATEPYLRFHNNLKPLKFNQPFQYKDEMITLAPVRHMLGTAQVMVKTEDGRCISYSSDFLMPGSKPLKTDALVIDATYGDPAITRGYNREKIAENLVSLVQKEIVKTPIRIEAHRGKIEEIMDLLTKANVNVPFLVPSKDYLWSKVYEKYGFKMGTYHDCLSPAAHYIADKGEPYVDFCVISPKHLPHVNYPKIRVSAQYAFTPFGEVRPNNYIASLSNHADFDGSLQFIRESGAKFVVTDNSTPRGGYATIFAEEIKQRLGVEAKAMPE